MEKIMFCFWLAVALIISPVSTSIVQANDRPTSGNQTSSTFASRPVPLSEEDASEYRKLAESITAELKQEEGGARGLNILKKNPAEISKNYLPGTQLNSHLPFGPTTLSKYDALLYSELADLLPEELQELKAGRRTLADITEWVGNPILQATLVVLAIAAVIAAMVGLIAAMNSYRYGPHIFLGIMAILWLYSKASD